MTSVSPDLAALVFGGAATALLVGGALAVLLRPLSATLHDVCGTRGRAQAWVALSCVGLAVGTLLAGLLGFGWAPHAGHAGSVGSVGAAGLDFAPVSLWISVWTSVRMVQWAIAGNLIGLAVIGAVVLAFTNHPPGSHG